MEVASGRQVRTLAGLSAWMLVTSCGSNEAAPPSTASGAGGMATSAGASGSEAGRGEPSMGAGRGGSAAGRAGGPGAGGTAGRGGSAAGGGTPGRGGSASGSTNGGAAGGAGEAAGGRAGAGEPTCLRDGDGKTTLVFVNGCAEPVTYAGSDIDGGTLAPTAVACVDIGTDVEELSAKRYWGFFGEDPGSEHHSLAEFTFNTDFNDFDWYNISYVDAFNLPLAITPSARPDCETLSCSDDFLAECPDAGKFEQGGAVVACVSPERDDGDSEVALYFEQCDDAYAWSGDDQNGDDPSPVRACAGEDWVITFCPGDGA